jgi:hypothetical protein
MPYGRRLPDEAMDAVDWCRHLVPDGFGGRFLADARVTCGGSVRLGPDLVRVMASTPARSRPIRRSSCGLLPTAAARTIIGILATGASESCTASLLTAFCFDAGKDLQGHPPTGSDATAPGNRPHPFRQGLAGATTRTLDRPDRPRCPSCYLPNQASTPAWSQDWYQNSEILPSRKCTTKTSLVEKVSPPRRMVPRCRTIPCSSSAR